MNDHKSHVTWSFQEFCMKNWILLVTLSSHTIYWIQSLNVNVFSALKHWYKKEIRAICQLRLDISKQEFIILYFQTKMLEFSVKNVILMWSEAEMHSINAEKMFKKLSFDSKRSCISLEISVKQLFNKTFTMTIQLYKLSENVLNKQFHSMSTTQRHI